jgi:hypothetical protein
VAVKTFEKSKLTEAHARKRVSREIRILKALSHPNIIRLYEVVDVPLRKYLIMQYSSGGDLCRYVRSAAAYPPGAALCGADDEYGAGLGCGIIERGSCGGGWCGLDWAGSGGAGGPPRPRQTRSPPTPLLVSAPSRPRRLRVPHRRALTATKFWLTQD